VVTSDRGLCGAFNANILRKSMEVLREIESRGVKVSVSIVGRKGRDFLTRRPWAIRQNWIGFLDRLTFEHGVDIGGELSDAYAKGTFDELYVVYNEFKSAIQQRVIVEKLFPISADFLFGHGHEAAEGQAAGGSYLYEPDEDQLLEALLPKHVHTQVYRILLESFAAFYGAQMAAMDGATRNAGELIKKVTLYYNKTRQAAITKELMDIVGGAEALK
jgi:F-type H+-transporting ATPase subunit gamma